MKRLFWWLVFLAQSPLLLVACIFAYPLPRVAVVLALPTLWIRERIRKGGVA